MRREIVNGRSFSPDIFGRNDRLSDFVKNTSVEEVRRRRKRRDGKVSVLNCLVVLHGQTVGECKGTGGDRRQHVSATRFVKKKDRERGFGKTDVYVQ